MINLNFDISHLMRDEFLKNLEWFEQEFHALFGSKTNGFTKEDIKVANEILDQLSILINQNRNKRLIFDLVSTLDKIELNYPELL